MTIKLVKQAVKNTISRISNDLPFRHPKTGLYNSILLVQYIPNIINKKLTLPIIDFVLMLIVSRNAVSNIRPVRETAARGIKQRRYFIADMITTTSLLRYNVRENYLDRTRLGNHNLRCNLG